MLHTAFTRIIRAHFPKAPILPCGTMQPNRSVSDLYVFCPRKVLNSGQSTELSTFFHKVNFPNALCSKNGSMPLHFGRFCRTGMQAFSDHRLTGVESPLKDSHQFSGGWRESRNNLRYLNSRIFISKNLVNPREPLIICQPARGMQKWSGCDGMLFLLSASGCGVTSGTIAVAGHLVV